MTGKVKWFNNSKGFGFIETENGYDVFVHYSDIVDTNENGYKTLIERERVEFEVVDTKFGMQAKNVKKVMNK